MIALIDGDMIIYKCGFICEDRYYTHPEIKGYKTKTKKELKELCESMGMEDYEEGIEIIIEPHEEYKATLAVDVTIDMIMKNTTATNMISFFSCKREDNYRRDFHTEYKMNRKGAPKPFYVDLMRDHMIKTYNGRMCVNMEADDALGIMQKKDASTIIVTNDKDLNQITGQHFNPTTNTTSVISRDQASFCYYKQILTGDTIDHIPGLWQVGDKTKLLDGVKPKDYHKVVESIYEDRWIKRELKLLEMDDTPDNRDSLIPAMYGQLNFAAISLWILRKDSEGYVQLPTLFGPKADSLSKELETITDDIIQLNIDTGVFNGTL